MAGRFCPILIGALLLVSLMTVPGLSGNTILSQKEGELHSVLEEIGTIQSELAGIEDRLEGICEELERAEQEFAGISEEVRQVEDDLQRTQGEIAIIENILEEKRERIHVLSARFETQLKTFNERLRSAYMSGFADYFQFFANSESVDDFFERLFLLQRVIRQDAELIQALHDDAESLKTEKAALEDELEKLSAKHEELASLQELLRYNYDRLGEAIKSRESLVFQLESEKAQYEAALDELTDSSRRLEVAIRALQGEVIEDDLIDDVTDFIWPLNGRISSQFGWRIHPILKTEKLHSGIDIAVVRGTPVRAAASGRVIYSGWVKGYGNTVIIDHGNLMTTLYAHNDELVARAGTHVKIGDVIAYSGNTGDSTGPHLHFEIRRDGSPVNPIDWLP